MSPADLARQGAGAATAAVLCEADLDRSIVPTSLPQDGMGWESSGAELLMDSSFASRVEVEINTHLDCWSLEAVYGRWGEQSRQWRIAWSAAHQFSGWVSIS